MPAELIVVGGGNAGFCAAHAAAERGASVTILEKAPEEAAGGNSFYTAGAFRVAHGGIDAVRELVEPDERLPVTDLAPYTPEDYRGDMERLTAARNDPAMTELLIADSGPMVEWLAERGIRWRLMYERQAYERDGRFLFWGGLALGTVDGGKGLIAQHTAAAREAGIRVEYGAAVTGLLDHGVRLGDRTLRGRRGDPRRRRLRGQRRAARAPPRPRDGDGRWCAGTRSTPARCCRPRSTPAPRRTATGPPATASPGTPRPTPAGETAS